MIEKQDTSFRKSISPNKKLAITLKFIATRESFFSLSTQFVVGESTVELIAKETCRAIVGA
jgi:3-hydroxymyristoyl/3-hydroxydecanoyl-(acyl carrier protein) dehydratase